MVKYRKLKDYQWDGEYDVYYFEFIKNCIKEGEDVNE